MNRGIYVLVALSCLAISFTSCLDTKDNNSIDEEWKAFNQKQINEVKNLGYTELASHSGNGSVYWKEITDFIPDPKSFSLKMTESGTPYFTDSVVVRYEGWYLKEDGTKYIFNSTEGYQNARPFRTRVNQLIDGWATMLQHMREGDQVEVCVPYLLGYGIYGNSAIPGYTTLRFKIKLLEIIPDNQGEFN